MMIGREGNALTYCSHSERSSNPLILNRTGHSSLQSALHEVDLFCVPADKGVTD